MNGRTNELAKRALRAWPPLLVEQSLIEAANDLEKRTLAARQDVSKIKMTPEAKDLFDQLRSRVIALASDIMEFAEPNSISYHGPAFFLEILPRANKLTLLLALDFNQVDDTSGLARDATEKKFFVHARHEGGVPMSIWDVDEIETAVPMIRQALSVSKE